MSGFAGRAGKPGPQGPAGTITLAPTVVGVPGSDPSVRNLGGVSNSILEFTLSTGATGAKGDKGDKGDQGPQPVFGLPVAVGLIEGASPTATITGTGTAGDPYILTLGIPKGDTGSQGPTGPTGPQPVFGSPSASQVAAGGSPTASISGDGTNANPYKLSFGIPKGDTGATGPQGATGATGQTGPRGLQGYPGAISGAGAPSSNVGDMIGQLYLDTSTGVEYKLTSLSPRTWTLLVPSVNASSGLSDSDTIPVTSQYTVTRPDMGYKVKKTGWFIMACTNQFVTSFSSSGATMATGFRIYRGAQRIDVLIDYVAIPTGSGSTYRSSWCFFYYCNVDDIVAPILSANPGVAGQWTYDMRIAGMSPLSVASDSLQRTGTP